MNYYCTLFDSQYLTKGLALYQSLVNVGEKFFLYVYAFDKLTKDILHDLELPNLRVVPLEEFETEELLAVKKTRTKGEYCWTCTAATILHCLEKFNLPMVTYLDSDIYFFDKPNIVLNEFRASQCDVMITRHNYTPKYDQTETSGVYNVQFMPFKNNDNAKRILKWWRDRCIEWCYKTPEKGLMGDQKYLDDWLDRFQGVYVMQNRLAGLAPWNIQQYDIKKGPVSDGQRVIFYHFHQLTWFRNDKRDWFGHPQAFIYELSEAVLNYIYRPYIQALLNSIEIIRGNYDNSFIKGSVFQEDKAMAADINLDYTPFFYGTFFTWEQAWDAANRVMRGAGGYESNLILNKVADSIQKVRRGEAAFERDGVAFAKQDYRFPLVTALLFVAANEKKLNVLDFGGSLGSTYFQNRDLLSGIPVEWHVVEQKSFVDYGQKNIPEVEFHYDALDCLNKGINCVLASSSLNYVDKPYKYLEKLLLINAKYMIIDLTYFNFENQDRITIEHVPESIYKAVYPAHLLNIEKFSSIILQKYEPIFYLPPLGKLPFVEGKNYRITPCHGWFLKLK